MFKMIVNYINSLAFKTMILQHSTPQNDSYTATYLPSHNLSKEDKQDMLSTVAEENMNS